MNYIVLDIEADGEKLVRKRFCDGLEPSHKIIMLQTKVADTEAKYKYCKQGISRDFPINLSKYSVLVGHNIRYDLLYLWKNTGVQEFISRVCKGTALVWDTKIVDYLLNGQNKLDYNLEELAKRYKVELKDDKCKPYFKQGYKFSEIPEEISIPYGLQDVITTEQIYLKQIQKVKSASLEAIVKDYLNHAVATIEMEFNGLCVDTEELNKKTKLQEEIVNNLTLLFKEKIKDYWPAEIEFNMNSSQHMSYLLFGGEIKVPADLPVYDALGQVVKYKGGKKAGQIKTKKGDVLKKIGGLRLDKELTAPAKKLGVYLTGDSVLQNYKDPIVEQILQYRSEHKKYTTYYLNYQECRNPYTGCVHPHINVSGTATGRLSMNSPSCQNLDPATFSVFTSRFKNGRIISIDFSTIEVRIAAILSQDTLMLEELKQGLDLHADNAKRLFDKKDISADERTLAKAMTFGILYGQGAKGMADRFKLDEGLCQRFIDSFYNKYCDLYTWHKKLEEEVETNKKLSSIGKPYSYIEDPLGKRYYLESYESVRGGYRFLPSQYKNYSIQGMAANIGSSAFFEVYKKCFDYKDTIVFNEIHDEILIDCNYQEEDAKFVAIDLANTMNNAANAVMKRTGLTNLVDIDCEYSIGKTLEEVKKK